MEYKKLGKFLLEKSLAKGGMGEVIRSIDDSGRTIALKTILKPFQESDTFRELFLREAQITFQLDHANIVKAYRFETIGNQLVLALEYLDGVTLKDVLRRIYDRKLSIPVVVAVSIMTRVLRGLDYAHKKRDENGQPLGIIHRDLNPSNVFVTYAGEVKILDFGISKATQKEIHRLTPNGEIRGKMCYLSPEQVRGKEIDHRADIFACGILMWELLTGRPLFLRDTESEVMEAISEGRYTPASTYRADLPPGFEGVLKKALALNRRDRFQSCAEFEAELLQTSRLSLIPGVAEDEISIFNRALFKKGVDERDPHFMSGYAWLLTQIPGQEKWGVEIARRIAQGNATRPYVQLNYARSLICYGLREDGLKVLKRLARTDSLEEVSQELLEWLGVRRKPIFRFLKRSHPLNHALGLIRHKILGPTPYQEAFLAA